MNFENCFQFFFWQGFRYASPPAKSPPSLRDFAKPCKGGRDLAVHMSHCTTNKKSRPEGRLNNDFINILTVP